MGEVDKNKSIQIHQSYIISPCEEGLQIIDQHAAHERILFEEFLSAFTKEKAKKKVSELKKPISISPSISEMLLLEEFEEVFKSLGFLIEHFGQQEFILRAVPSIFKGRNNEKIIKEMLVDLANETSKDIDTKTKRMLQFLSCRAAIKAGDALTSEQVKDLLEKLDQTENNKTCPHGRPTQILVTLQELATSFKR